MPQPDVVWVKRRDYSQSRPIAEDVLLLVEVAGSSLAYDAGEKADLYAAAGIADYWLVNLAARSIQVRRDPVDGRYTSLTTLTGEQEARPLCYPDVALAAGALWEQVA